MPQVAVLLDVSYGHARGVLRGALRFARTDRPVKLLTSLHGFHGPMPFGHVRIDGVLGMLFDDTLDERLHGLGVPVVNVSSSRADAEWPRVTPDDVAVGRMAAEHLLERGFRAFGFFTNERLGWSADRERGFVDAVEGAGFDCRVFRPDRPLPPERVVPVGLHEWIDSLPRPIGVFCGDEYLAWTFIGTAQDVGAQVPEQMAVVAVGNDPLVCESCDVPLSAVDAGSERIGFEAMALLTRLMDGQADPAERVSVEPSHVQTRRSSDVLAIEDPHVAAALRLINLRACDSLTVPEVLETIPVNRRWLERRFRDRLGRTIQGEIMRVRLERAKELLIDSELKIEAIAEQCGFPSGQHFHAVFRKATDTTPARYRRDRRAG